MGTHNRLLNLGGGLIWKSSPWTPKRPRWFALDRFTGKPRLLTWVARTVALEGYPVLELGPVCKASRGDLERKITIPEDGRLHWGGALPDSVGPPAPYRYPAGYRLPPGGVEAAAFFAKGLGPGTA